MLDKKEVTLKELILGTILVLMSYFVTAILNLSNEDIYNNNLSEIFKEGGIFNITAFLLACLWLIITVIWILSVMIRIVKVFIGRIKN